MDNQVDASSSSLGAIINSVLRDPSKYSTEYVISLLEKADDRMDYLEKENKKAYRQRDRAKESYRDAKEDPQKDLVEVGKTLGNIRDIPATEETLLSAIDDALFCNKALFRIDAPYYFVEIIRKSRWFKPANTGDMIRQGLLGTFLSAAVYLNNAIHPETRNLVQSDDMKIRVYLTPITPQGVLWSDVGVQVDAVVPKTFSEQKAETDVADDEIQNDFETFVGWHDEEELISIFRRARHGFYKDLNDIFPDIVSSTLKSMKIKPTCDFSICGGVEVCVRIRSKITAEDFGIQIEDGIESLKRQVRMTVKNNPTLDKISMLKCLPAHEPTKLRRGCVLFVVLGRAKTIGTDINP